MTDKKHVTSTTRTSQVKVNLGLSCQESTKNTGLHLNLVEERLAGITLAHRMVPSHLAERQMETETEVA